MDDLFLSIQKPGDIRLQIGELVKAMRVSKGITQGQLASALNLSRLTIQKVESGKNFTIDTLLLIFQHFDVLDSLAIFIAGQRDEFKDIQSLY